MNALQSSIQGRFRVLPMLLLASVLLVVCSGCVWLRLLTVKNQLMHFDDNFVVEVDNGFVLHFRNPPLFGTDLPYLASMEPSLNVAMGDETRHIFLFEKLPLPDREDPNPRPLTFYSTINEEGMLRTFRFAPVFLEIVPPEFMEHSIRALALAQVDRENRKMRADTSQLARGKLVPPKKTDVVEGLGLPHETEQNEEGDVLTYCYRLRPPAGSTISSQKGIATLQLIFSPENDSLARFRGQFANLKLSVNYQKILKQQKESQNAAASESSP